MGRQVYQANLAIANKAIVSTRKNTLAVTTYLEVTFVQEGTSFSVHWIDITILA